VTGIVAPPFVGFPKIARYSRLCTITEKIDGTNASIFIDDLGVDFRTASRTKWITPENDNMGFSLWAHGLGCHELVNVFEVK